jgi:hypothetical protein
MSRAAFSVHPAMLRMKGCQNPTYNGKVDTLMEMDETLMHSGSSDYSRAWQRRTCTLDAGVCFVSTLVMSKALMACVIPHWVSRQR